MIPCALCHIISNHSCCDFDPPGKFCILGFLTFPISTRIHAAMTFCHLLPGIWLTVAAKYAISGADTVVFFSDMWDTQKRCFPGYSPLTPINLYVYHVYLVSIIIWTYFDITWYFDKYPLTPSCFPWFMAVDPWGQTSPSLSDSTMAVLCTLRFLTAGPGFFVEAPGHTHSHEVTETRQANLSGRKRWWNHLVKKLTHFVPENCKGLPCFLFFVWVS